MKLLITFLLLCWTPTYAQNPEDLSNLDPLNADEKRDVLKQLDELAICRDQVRNQDQQLLEERAQCTKEKTAADKELQAEKRLSEVTTRERDLAIKERDLEREQKETWKRMYEIAMKKPGLRCRILSAIFTAGIYQCRP